MENNKITMAACKLMIDIDDVLSALYVRWQSDEHEQGDDALGLYHSAVHSIVAEHDGRGTVITSQESNGLYVQFHMSDDCFTIAIEDGEITISCA